MKIASKLVQEISTFIQTRHLQAIDEQVNIIESYILTAIENEDVKSIQLILEKLINELSTSKYINRFLMHFMRIEKVFTVKLPEQLALIYCHIGDIYYYDRNFSSATKYYEQCISYGTRYKQYELVSTAINKNFSIQIARAKHDLKITPVDLHIAKSISLITLVDNQGERIHYTKDIIVKMYAYLELLILQGDLDCAESLLNDFLKHPTIELYSREHLQLISYYGFFLEKKGEIEKAIDLYNHTLYTCLENESDTDLIEFVYIELIKLSNRLDGKIPNNHVDLHSLKSNFDSVHRLRKKYIEEATSDNLSFTADCVAVGLPYKQFVRDYAPLFFSHKGEGTTLVIIDFILKQNATSSREDVFKVIFNEMKNEFGSDLLATCIFERNNIAFILPLSEDEIDPRLFKRLMCIKNGQTSIQVDADSFYFASVNNKQHHYNSFEKCRQLAYVYLYCELYKKEQTI
jgi:tetratricopeptide (TPR) repeat protein